MSLKPAGPPVELPPLYACDPCRRVGVEASAVAHELATGHVSERVPDHIARGVREVWARENRSLIDGEGQGFKP